MNPRKEALLESRCASAEADLLKFLSEGKESEGIAQALIKDACLERFFSTGGPDWNPETGRFDTGEGVVSTIGQDGKIK